MFNIKRVYDEKSKEDGYRVLVDRLWPRGLSKQDAQIDLWLKEIAPSTELRKWFNHEAEKWNDFIKKYKQELQSKKELVEQLKQLEKEHKKISLVYSAKDTKHNQAVVLQSFLSK